METNEIILSDDINSAKISIIVPVYNTENFLGECLKSLISQTYKNIEIIAVNDGSTDESLAVLRCFEKQDARIKIIDKENGGLASARNVGLELASGKYVMFVDSDDYLEPEAAGIACRKMEEDELDACMFSHFLLHGNEKTERKVALDKTVYKEDDVKNELIPELLGKKHDGDKSLFAFVWAQVFKREVIGNQLFLSERKYYMEDLLFDLGYYLKVKKFAVLSAPLYNYRVVAGSLTNSYRKDLFDKFNNLFDYIKKYMDDNGYSEEYERLYRRAFYLSIAAVKNVKASPELKRKEKKKKILEISQNEYVKTAVKTLKFKGIKNKAFAFLLKTGAAGVILKLC